MKKALSVAALLTAILMLALCCAACGGEEKKDEATAPSATEATATVPEATASRTADIGALAGSYKCVDAVLESGEMTEEDMEKMRSTYSVEIAGDGTGRILFWGQSIECVFDPEAMTVKPTFGDGEALPFTFDGTRLSLIVPGTGTMVFEKE